MRKTAIIVIVAVALVATLAFLRRKAGEFNHDEQGRFQTALWQIKQFDTTFNEDLLKSRFALLNNYDDFQARNEEMKSSLEMLTQPPTFVTPAGRGAIETARKEYRAVLEQRQSLFERFKTHNAMVGNSRRYLPLALEEMAGRLDASSNASPDTLELRSALADLGRLLLMRLSTHDDVPEQTRARLQRFKDWCSDHPDHPDARFASSLAQHAQIIMTGQSEVDVLTRQLLALPTGAAIQKIFAVFQTEVTGALDRAQQYRVMFYGLGVVLLAGLGYSFWALRAANRNLDQRVRERTSELEAEITERKRIEAEVAEMNRRLVVASRQAGMAEVATSVLHNVGNVLNSVNVSATIVAEANRKSKVVNLHKVVALLDDHASDLGGFITTDPKGVQLPGYLRQLSEHLTREQQSAIDELDSLCKHIEHIKNIVAMQQNFASVSGVRETVLVPDLVEDALRLNYASLQRHAVQVQREFATLPRVTVDKHKAIQILVNLINNAKQACDDANRDDKQLIIRGASNGGTVSISITDNGVGIPPENLTRIFNHGFTTKKNGHGFGLHSGANAAREIGGTLSGHSDGPGSGATFTLELPGERETA